jgi:hypothetical protein
MELFKMKNVEFKNEDNAMKEVNSPSFYVKLLFEKYDSGLYDFEELMSGMQEIYAYYDSWKYYQKCNEDMAVMQQRLNKKLVDTKF